MENIEENVVTKGAAKADPMPASGAQVEDLGGPTPENYKPDDDSAKLKDPSATLAQVKDVVNAKAMKAEEAETEEEVIEEEEATTDEVVAEEETASEEESTEVVAEEETSEEETVAEEEEKYDVEADVAALLQGEELSEEFQSKAKTIFEAASKRIKNTKIIEDEYLDTIKNNRSKPRVPFGSLVELGIIKPGTEIFDQKKQINAKIMIDGSIKYRKSEGSIHKVAAQILGAESCNGWTFWYYKSGNSLKPIDDLRQRLRPTT